MRERHLSSRVHVSLFIKSNGFHYVGEPANSLLRAGKVLDKVGDGRCSLKSRSSNHLIGIMQMNGVERPAYGKVKFVLAQTKRLSV